MLKPHKFSFWWALSSMILPVLRGASGVRNVRFQHRPMELFAQETFPRWSLRIWRKIQEKNIQKRIRLVFCDLYFSTVRICRRVEVALKMIELSDSSRFVERACDHKEGHDKQSKIQFERKRQVRGNRGSPSVEVSTLHRSLGVWRYSDYTELITRTKKWKKKKKKINARISWVWK